MPPRRLSPDDPLAAALAEREAAQRHVVHAFHLLEIAHRRQEPTRKELAAEAQATVERLRQASKKVQAARLGTPDKASR